MKPRHHQPTHQHSRWDFLGCPLVSLVLALLLFADAISMPQTTPVGRFVNQPRVRSDSAFFIAYLIRARDIPTGQPDNPRYRLLDIDRESSDELTRLLTQSTQPIAEILLTPHTKTSGTWSVLTTQRQWKLSLSALNTDSLDTNLTTARETLFHHPENITNIDSFSTRFLDALDAVHNPEKPTFLWRGLANDLAVLTTWLLLGMSIFRWRRWFARHPLSRTSRRIAQNRCPVCGYPQQNLPSNTCPECGTHTNK